MASRHYPHSGLFTAWQFEFEFCAAVTFDAFVFMIAEFESAARCTSFQHPPLPQPVYMMSAGAGNMNILSHFVYCIGITSLIHTCLFLL